MWPFRELEGSWMWLANQTRSDISNAVSAVARLVHAPKQKHWKGGRGILEHLNPSAAAAVTATNNAATAILTCAVTPTTAGASTKQGLPGTQILSVLNC